MAKEPKLVEIDEEGKDQFDRIAKQLRDIEVAEFISEEHIQDLSNEVSKLKSPAARKAFLDLPAVKDLLDKYAQETQEKGTEAPGSIKRLGVFSVKIPWKRDDLEKFPKVNFYAEREYNIIWNGIKYLLAADMNHEIPEPVYQIIQDQRVAEREARAAERAGYMGGARMLESGWAGKDNVDREAV